MTDAAMTAWLAAAKRGGYPVPRRADRWQVMRAGVVNLWEFEQAEFWYADGWAQLSGRNETGKSTLMALTTLIPWLGETAPANIDTFARAGKSFRFYVEPTGGDGDRRSTEAAANRGWLWVEYGRIIDGAPRYFTSLLFAEARGAGALDLKWCTLDGDQRVREHLRLAPGRSVVSWKEVDSPGFTAHATAGAYRQYVATRLLGASTERLEAVGKMLRVTRTPKLGAELRIGFVRDKLRDALPELNRTEIDALATGWDQLDQIRADLESTKTAVGTIAMLRKRSWVPWAEAALRLRADDAAAARTDFDRVTRIATEASQTLTQREAEEQELSEQVGLHRAEADSARAAAEALQASARYRDAESRLASLGQHRFVRDRLASQVAEHEQDVATADGRLKRVAAEAADVETSRADAVAHQDHTLSDFAAAASVVRLTVVPTGFDADLADQHLKDLAGAVDRAEILTDQASVAEGRADRADDVAAQATERARGDRTRAEAGWESAQRTYQGLISALSTWAGTVHPRVSPDVVDAWISSLPLSDGDDGPTEPLRAAVRQAWFEPALTPLERARMEADRLRAEALGEAARCADEIERLGSAPTPVFAGPVTWGRRTRPDVSPDGAPLWSLVNPRPGLAESDLAGIEAGLAAMGLLDAWVTTDGVYVPERDGDDVVTAVSHPVADPTLASCLDVACDAGLAATVHSVLAGIGLAPADTAAPVAVWPDGRWCTPGLSGRARPAHGEPEWIGEAARAAGRRRRILELAEQKATWLHEAESRASRVAGLDEDLAGLRNAFARCPDDTELRGLLGLATERESVATESATEADRLRSEAARLRSAADSTRALVLEFCANRGLPGDMAGLRTMRANLAQASHRLTAYRQAVHAVTRAESTLVGVRARLDEATATYATHVARRDDASRQLADADATVAAISSTIDADDHAILAELDRLKAGERAARDEADRSSERLRGLSAQVGAARQALETTEANRRAATAQRDEAYAAFRQLIARGLADDAGVDLPQPEASTIDAVRDQVAQVRQRVSPRHWPDAREAREILVKRLESELRTAAVETRTPLEAGSRTLRLETDDVGLPRVEIVVDASGVALGLREAEARLGQILSDMQAMYNQKVQDTLDTLLGATFLEHLRDRLGDAYGLVDQINAVLAEHRLTTTQTALAIRLQPATAADKTMVEAVRGSALMNPDVFARVRDYLRNRVDEAKQTAAAEGLADWHDRLASTLDYRGWLDVNLQCKIGRDGRWEPLTTKRFTEMSGGARAVMLMLPLVSTLAALYQEMPAAPRPLWLDEAFDGLDGPNRAMVMGLFQDFDLDVLLASPSRLVNVPTVPTAAIYQVVRAPAPMPGVDLLAELWSGGELTQVDLPLHLPAGSPDPTEDQLA